MTFTATKYDLCTVATGRIFTDEGWTLDDPQCDVPSMVRPVCSSTMITSTGTTKPMPKA